MLGNDLLYAPVTEGGKPIDVISMRDINLYLAPLDDATTAAHDGEAIYPKGNVG